MNGGKVILRNFRCFKEFVVVPWLLSATVSIAQTPSIVMASTTSTEQSGLFGHLLPEFKKATEQRDGWGNRATGEAERQGFFG